MSVCWVSLLGAVGSLCFWIPDIANCQTFLAYRVRTCQSFFFFFFFCNWVLNGLRSVLISGLVQGPVHLGQSAWRCSQHPSPCFLQQRRFAVENKMLLQLQNKYCCGLVLLLGALRGAGERHQRPCPGTVS